MGSVSMGADDLPSEISRLEAEFSALKAENEKLEKKYEAARNAAIERARLAAALSANKTMRAYRKMMAGVGKGDPFAALRPQLTQAEAGILSNVDSVTYRKGNLVVRGWAYDLNGAVPPIAMRDRSHMLSLGIQHYPRPDVNEELDLEDDVCSGFVVRTPLADIHHDKITIEFENEFGYVAREIEIIRNEKKREAYLAENAEPTYAVDNAGYDDWFHDQRVTDEELERQKTAHFPYEPKISIVIPLFNTKSDFLVELMETLVGQSYRNIEICLADGSTSDEPGDLIRERYGRDSRIVYRRLAKNEGISGNTNAAIEMATGDFLMLADHDDTLEKDACFEIVRALNADPEIDVVYTDEDKILLTDDIYYSPNFKPDYSPDLLTSNNYITHIFCVRKSVVDQVGGERAEYDGAQDHDFIFRCCESARKVHHIPKFLYHWRAHASSTAGNPESKMYAYDSGRRAVEDHYRRMGIPAKVELAEDIGSFRSIYEIQGEPLVSIIIPNKDLSKVLRRAVESIFEKSTYRNFEIVICENNSTEEETFAYYDELVAAHDNVRVVRWKGGFNFSAINNFAAKKANGDYLLFLNNDVEVITDRWIEELLGYCQRPDVGACGARLYYPNDKLQHCGIVVGIGGIAGHICHLEKRSSGGYFGRIVKTQDVSAVTAACMMVPRKVFEEVGGFDKKFAVAYNDVDLCLKIREKGYFIVYDAWCQLYHYESLSRGSDEEEEDPKKHARQMAEARRLRAKWPEIYEKGDPYFNANLDYCTSDFVLKGTMPPNYSTLQKAKEEVSGEDA
ncbi:MAG: glycosyltransferase family 2 protein, partial [Lachnospiraceae bacterium]|nr:glycosyltransferase family 2 protein [Lachnospiraceae bacterium]